MSTPTVTVTDVDRIVSLLCGLGWYQDRDLEMKGQPNRKVFRKKWYTVVVGPLWTTHYRTVKETMFDLDSTKTSDYHAIEKKVKELNRG